MGRCFGPLNRTWRWRSGTKKTGRIGNLVPVACRKIFLSNCRLHDVPGNRVSAGAWLVTFSCKPGGNKMIGVVVSSYKSVWSQTEVHCLVRMTGYLALYVHIIMLPLFRFPTDPVLVKSVRGSNWRHQATLECTGIIRLIVPVTQPLLPLPLATSQPHAQLRVCRRNYDAIQT